MRSVIDGIMARPTTAVASGWPAIDLRSRRRGRQQKRRSLVARPWSLVPRVWGWWCNGHKANKALLLLRDGTSAAAVFLSCRCPREGEKPGKPGNQVRGEGFYGFLRVFPYP